MSESTRFDSDRFRGFARGYNHAQGMWYVSNQLYELDTVHKLFLWSYPPFGVRVIAAIFVLVMSSYVAQLAQIFFKSHSSMGFYLISDTNHRSPGLVLLDCNGGRLFLIQGLVGFRQSRVLLWKPFRPVETFFRVGEGLGLV